MARTGATRETILQEALLESGSDENSTLQISNYYNTYDRYFLSLLDKQPWIFCYKIIENPEKTSVGNNLGYKYRYLMKPDVLEVLSLDPDQTRVQYSSPSEAAEYGISTTWDDLYRQPTKDYVLIDGVLHTNKEVTELFVKVIPDIGSSDVDFQETLILMLARFFVFTLKLDSRMSYDLERRSKQAFLIAKNKNDKRIRLENSPDFGRISAYIRGYFNL